MCQSLTEGGRRCAAHTRPKFQSAIEEVQSCGSRRAQQDAMVRRVDDVMWHAVTPTGAIEVAAVRDYAERSGDHTLAGFLGMGERMAVGAKQALAESAAESAEAEAAAAAREAVPSSAAVPLPEDAWDPGQPALDVGEHWSIAEGGTRWHEGGCGAFAIAMTERWPHLQIACEMYDDHGAESVAHAWAYDPATNRRFHIFGAEKWQPTSQPDYDRGSHRVLLGQSAEDVRRLFRGHNCGEDSVYDALEVACEMFDPGYVPPDGDDEFANRNHLYFW